MRIKSKTINRLLIVVDKLLIGGAMSYPFLKAKGINIGKSLCDDSDVELATSILRADKLKKIELPLDHVVVKNFEDNQGNITTSNEIAAEYLGLDIGPKTIAHYQELLSKAKTIFWNGLMGYFEKKSFAHGTFAMAEHLAGCKEALTIIGGGD